MVDTETKYIHSMSQLRRLKIQLGVHGHQCCFCRKVPDEVVEADFNRKYVHAKECCKCHRRVVSYEPTSI